MDLETPALKIQNLLESNPLKSRFLVRGVATGAQLLRRAPQMACYRNSESVRMRYCSLLNAPLEAGAVRLAKRSDALFKEFLGVDVASVQGENMKLETSLDETSLRSPR